MYLPIKIRHDILNQYHGNDMEVKIFNYMYMIEIDLRIFLQKMWVS